MAGESYIYPGGKYPLDAPDYSDFSVGMDSKISPKVSTFGITSDPRSSNQVASVSLKLNTGAKTIEVQGLSLGGSPMDLIDNMPKQQFKELNRLKQLVGAELTFHGPLVEPTGISRSGWNDTERQQAERMMSSAVERAHELDPKGNIVVTFHASSGLPELNSKVINDKTGKEEVASFWIVNERDGSFNSINPKENFLEGKKFKTEKEIKDYLVDQNQELWLKQLQNVNFHAFAGAEEVNRAFSISDEDNPQPAEGLTEFYKKYVTDPVQAQKEIEQTGEHAPRIMKNVQRLMHGDIYLRDAYQELQQLFNQAYLVASKDNNKDDLDKLDNFKNEIQEKKKILFEPEHVGDLAQEVIKGINILRSISPPQIQKPLREFALDKASDTFGNVAFKAFSDCREKGEGPPIISIENPPAGSGLSRAEDLKELIKQSRDKFKDRAVKELKMDEKNATEWANKLIGATWDVGHINMIRKFGYGEKELIEETKTIAPMVKHVHLSDNFGLDHTELPMGMGNVPTKQHLELIDKYNKQAKKIVEVGKWWQDFKVNPFKDTLVAFGSPAYSMKMAPYWSQTAGRSAGYWTGYGPTLPDQHFQMYGAGFSTLPPELGGQMAGRSRLSGTPTE